MHEEAPLLSAKKRERLGSRYSRRVRDAGGLPAVVYGHKEDPVSISLDAHSALQMIMKGERVFTLEIEGGATETVLLKDLQYDYLGSNPVHADFARVDLNERVDVTVPLHFVGDAPGLKKAGAVMMHPISELDLECTVTNLPDSIEVDLSEMEAGDMIHASEVKLPKDTMVLRTDGESVVARIVIQEAAPESDEESAVAEPEIAGAEKKEEKKEG
ncbi:MAG: 50S ribosomal protein L25 [Planctomycetota bacterium]